MREVQSAAIVLHVLHPASEEPMHGTWMGEELARHERDGLLASDQLVARRRAVRELTREVLTDE